MQHLAIALAFVLVGSAAQAQVFVPDIVPLDGTMRPITGTWTYPPQPQSQQPPTVIVVPRSSSEDDPVSVQLMRRALRR